ncbi:MAG: hypothetical protein ABI475_03010 [Methylophilaceae bacterium]
MLTPEQLKQQEELAARIVQELVTKERTDELVDLAKMLKLGTGK